MDDFFRFSKKLGFVVFLVHPTVVSVLLSASVERCFVSRMRDFFKKIGEQGSSGHHPNNWLFTANHPPPGIGLAAGQVSMEGDWRRLGPFRVGLEGGW